MHTTLADAVKAARKKTAKEEDFDWNAIADDMDALAKEIRSLKHDPKAIADKLEAVIGKTKRSKV